MMRTFISSSVAAGFAAALFTACSGPAQAPLPAGGVAPGSLSHGHSWITPTAKSQTLLYVSSVVSGDVYVYSYATRQLVGTLTGFSDPYGLCADTAGDVWIVNDGEESIVEYAHGGTKPIATLSDPDENPEGCSVDPTTGNLAVANFSNVTQGGSVSIYTGAKGNPKIYYDPQIAWERFCGYDPHGNLFVDGATSSSEFQLAELPKGAGTFTNIDLAEKIEWPGGVQWDGKYVAVGDTDTGIIYRINGAKGEVKGSLQLSGADYVNQFWIEPGKKSETVVAPSQDGGSVGYYAYPAGGSPKETIAVSEPFGATVSK
jgi:hypothetical protein